MFPIRSNERQHNDNRNKTFGISVVLPNDRRYFFPGGSTELASIIMKLNLTEDKLTHPDTQIEFGEADGDRWTQHQLIKERATKLLQGPSNALSYSVI